VLELIIVDTLVSSRNNLVLKFGFPIIPKLYIIEREIYCGRMILNKKDTKLNGLFLPSKRNLREKIKAMISKTEEKYAIKVLPLVNCIKKSL
tara:strand:+ start:207 stop:482 length:276 start_codon:yes stop_codon:yes gene_type:complete